MKKYLILFCAIVLALLIFYKHEKLEDFDWKCEIFADQSGYYVYLPATFIYHFSAEKMPENIVNKTGLGFKFDSSHNRILTKYT